MGKGPKGPSARDTLAYYTRSEMRPDTHSLGVADNAKDEAQNTHKLGGGRKEKKKERKGKKKK